MAGDRRRSEYGFYSNVNPSVDHPRWSQATERRIGEFFKRKTLMFNGYGDQVASLYAGMDLEEELLRLDALRPMPSDRTIQLGAQAGRVPGRPRARSAWLVWAALTGNLSANPLSDITNETGVWTLRFLCITLAITPLRRLTGWNADHPVPPDGRALRVLLRLAALPHLRHRRPLRRRSTFPDGIVAWTRSRNLATSVGEDIYKRPFITIGFTAFVLMVPLAVTSTAGLIRRLGGKRWQALHRLVYVAGDRRRRALLVAGEGRHQQSVHATRS